MTERILDWQAIEDSKELTRRLQGFCCTKPWPTTPQGRRLSQHPRPWEWDAHRHVRNLGRLLREGDRAMIGVDLSTDEAIDAAVVHLRYLVDGPKFVAKVEVGAVALSHRSPDPPFIGDDIMQVAREEALIAMDARGGEIGILAGIIHVQNDASMRMATRNGWEPQGDPGLDGYVRWIRPLP